jgi:hypothetical protein
MFQIVEVNAIRIGRIHGVEHGGMITPRREMAFAATRALPRPQVKARHRGHLLSKTWRRVEKI